MSGQYRNLTPQQLKDRVNASITNAFADHNKEHGTPKTVAARMLPSGDLVAIGASMSDTEALRINENRYDY